MKMKNTTFDIKTKLMIALTALGIAGATKAQNVSPGDILQNSSRSLF
jgi:hypothetical protein